jgi:hypothetical protein
MKNIFVVILAIVLLVSSVLICAAYIPSMKREINTLSYLSDQMEKTYGTNTYSAYCEMYKTQSYVVFGKTTAIVGSILYAIFATINMKKIITITNTDHAIRYTYEEYKAKMDAKKAEIKEKKLQSKKERLRKELEEMEKAE